MILVVAPAGDESREENGPRPRGICLRGQGEELVRHGAPPLDVPLPEGKHAGTRERVAAKLGVARRAGCKRRLEPATALAPVAPRPPEEPDRAAEPKRGVGAPVLERVPERRTDVVVLRFEPVEPDRRAPGQQLGLRQLCELEEELGVLAPQLVRLTRVLESLERELADRLQHPEAGVREPDQAPVHQRLRYVQIGTADGLGRFQRAAAGKHREPREQALLVAREQVVAPCNRRPQGLLTRLGVPAAHEQIEPLRKTLQDLGRGQHARPGRSQLDRERQVIQPAAQLGDVIAPLQLRALAEELDRLGLRQRRHRILNLAADAQQLPARHQNAEIRTRLEQRTELRRRLHHLLEVVQQ